MMTFSLKPRRRSTLPSVAASVSTRVVSWNEAAEMKLSVSSEALVMPSNTGSRFGGFAALLDNALVLLLELELVDLIAPEQRRVAGIGDLHLAQHLADDDLDVLVVNLHALEPVNFLHFVDQVLLQFLRPADFENFVRNDRTFGQLLAFLHEVALEDDDVLRQRDQMLFFGARSPDPSQ